MNTKEKNDFEKIISSIRAFCDYLTEKKDAEYFMLYFNKEQKRGICGGTYEDESLANALVDICIRNERVRTLLFKVMEEVYKYGVYMALKNIGETLQQSENEDGNQ